MRRMHRRSGGTVGPGGQLSTWTHRRPVRVSRMGRMARVSTQSMRRRMLGVWRAIHALPMRTPIGGTQLPPRPTAEIHRLTLYVHSIWKEKAQG